MAEPMSFAGLPDELADRLAAAPRRDQTIDRLKTVVPNIKHLVDEVAPPVN